MHSKIADQKFKIDKILFKKSQKSLVPMKSPNLSHIKIFHKIWYHTEIVHPITFYNHAKNYLYRALAEKLSKNPNAWYLITLNLQIKIFSKYGTILKWCTLLPSSLMQKLEIPLNPWIKIVCQNCSCINLFTLLTPNFMQSSRKIKWAVSKIFKDKRTDGGTDGLTDGLTDKGDYYGPHRVNLGSKKIKKSLIKT